MNKPRLIKKIDIRECRGNCVNGIISKNNGDTFDTA